MHVYHACNHACNHGSQNPTQAARKAQWDCFGLVLQAFDWLLCAHGQCLLPGNLLEQSGGAVWNTAAGRKWN